MSWILYATLALGLIALVVPRLVWRRRVYDIRQSIKLDEKRRAEFSEQDRH